MNMHAEIVDGAEEALLANAVRFLAIDAVEAANSGHPGLPLGMADVAAVLFGRFIKIDPREPAWPDRDRFILSAGHGSMLLYATHHLLGYADMDADQLRSFRQLGSAAAGHPEFGHALGVETTTGPLGQGLATAVGMALAERMLNARFGDDLVDHFTYVVVGDGCLMEGISHEAIDLAGHLGLGRLIVLWDDNRITIDGSTSLSTSMDQCARFAAAGWHTSAVDGHDRDATANAISAARRDPRPSFIACSTIIGFGAPTKQGTHHVHGAPLGAAEVAATRDALDWTCAPFEVPEAARSAGRRIAARGASARVAWRQRLETSPKRSAFEKAHGALEQSEIAKALEAHKQSLIAGLPDIATRKASELALEAIEPAIPNLVGGSADLTGSNNTRTSAMRAVTRDDYSGSYVHYGIREHAMAAAMNGLSLHGGLIPYGGTFLAFSDYCRPAMRLSSLMGRPVVFVMTHDSIGLGEDGPTHQPVEHFASLRAMPNMLVFRPADAIETAECWACALAEVATPSTLCLSRQTLPTFVRSIDTNLAAQGAYVLRSNDERDLTLVATGSEVEIAVAAADLLSLRGVSATVVSAPCFELFARQPAKQRDRVLGAAPRIGIEAGVSQGWSAMLRPEDAFVGMSGYGASAPAADLYRHFSITAERVVDVAIELLASREARS